jgi:hypothetical protein
VTGSYASLLESEKVSIAVTLYIYIRWTHSSNLGHVTTNRAEVLRSFP